LSDDYSVQERFLRQFYNGFKHQSDIGIKGITMATRSSLIRIYEKLIDNNPEAIFNKLLQAAEKYNRVIVPDHEKNESTLTTSLNDLYRVGGAPSHILLIYLLVNKEDALTDEQLAKIIDVIVKFIVRRHLTDTPPTRDLPRHFITIIELIKDMDNGELIYAAIRKSLITISVSNQEFKERLNRNLYDENAGLTRFLLCKIEESEQTRENSIDLWARDDKKRFVFTVEHIFPQGDNIPEQWISDIAEGDSDKAKLIQEEYVHTLGNLTLSGYNSKLGNMSFEKKRDRTDKGKPIGYKNGLYLNSGLSKKSKWTVEDIESRTESLINNICTMFDFLAEG
jgi:hypothetical protein